MDLSEIKGLVDDGILQGKPDYDLVRNKFDKLINAGFIKKEDKDSYAFKDDVTWEIVYETLLYSERRHLHDLVALHIEKNKADELNHYSARLVYHFGKSQNKKKTIFYSAMAGKYAYSLFAIDDALSFYRKARNTLTSVNNYPIADECALLESEADIMEGIGSFPEAISLYNDALSAFEKSNITKRTFLPERTPIQKQKSQLCHKLSVAHERTLNYQDSLKYLDKAENYLPSRPGYLPVKINATRGVVYFRQMKFDDSLKYARKSLSIAKRLNLFSDIAYAHNIIANIYMGTGKYNHAIESLKNALFQYENISDLIGMSRTYFNMGVAYVNLYDIDNSNVYYNKALELHKKMRDKLSIMYVYFMLGGNKIHAMEFDSAISDYELVIKMYEDGVKRDDLYGVSLAKLAEIYIEIDNIEKAEHYINQSIDVLSKLTQMPDKLLQARLILAQLRMKQKKYHDAESICLDLIQSFLKSDTTGMEIFLRRLLGTIYRDMNKYTLAKDVLNEAYSKAGNIGLEYEQYCIKNVLYDIEVKEGNLDKSIIDEVNKLLTIFKERGDTREELLSKEIIRNIKNNQ